MNFLVKNTYQANEIIECSKNFSIQEMRIFYLGLQGLFPELPSQEENYHDVNFKPIIIKPKDLINIFGGNKWYYSELEKTCISLGKKAFNIKNENSKKFKVIPVFQLLEFDALGDGLTIEFNIRMKPYLLELVNRPFTKISMKEVFNLRSEYAIRLLELMLQYQNSITKTREISVDDLRFFLSIPDNLYKGRMGNFKNRVLDKPLKEINANTKYKISYISLKKGCKITGFRFTLETSKIEKLNKTFPITDKFEKASPAMHALLEIGLVKNVAADIEKLFSEKRIIKTVERVKIESKKMKINNLPGFVANAIKDDYYNIESNSLNEKGQINTKQKTVDAAKNMIPEFEQDKVDNTVDEKSLFAQFLKNTTSKIGNID